MATNPTTETNSGEPEDTGEVSIGGILIDTSIAHKQEIEPDDIPGEIREITLALAQEHPPTNPIVVMKGAQWWYHHGKGSSDPVFQWGIEWILHVATDHLTSVERYREFCDYLVDLDVVDSKGDL